MGLHNRPPGYAYKRGNLFNTYLGYSDDQPARAEETRSRSYSDPVARARAEKVARAEKAYSRTKPKRSSSKPKRSSSDPAARAGETRSRSKPKRSSYEPKRNSSPAKRPATTPAVDELARFIRAHFTPAEKERFTRLIAADLGVAAPEELQDDWMLNSKVRLFLEQHLSVELAAKYLEALTGRLERGEPLIRK
jgi:hypothetical protein